MRSVSKLLLDHGANEVQCVALAKTAHYKGSDSEFDEDYVELN